MKSGIWICSKKSLDHIHAIKLLSSVFNFSIVKINANFTVPLIFNNLIFKK
ncbi:MAG: hypothetical protein LBT10_07330 [Methanobrevibacter sp.]|nr:hypothetical protein [Methanobrevibacter sp.]